MGAADAKQTIGSQRMQVEAASATSLAHRTDALHRKMAVQVGSILA
jgi:hypothetical protein